MEFRIETAYNQKAMTAMARALRKTVRKKHSRRSHRLGWCVVILGLLLMFSAEVITFRLVITLLAVLMIVLALIWEDSLNGYIAKRRGLPGLNQSVVTFHEESYHSETAVGSSDFYYDNIIRFAETKEYFVFVFGNSHAQVYDKMQISGGTCEEFVEFITRKTGLSLESV